MSRQTSETPTDWELFLLKILWANGQQTVDQIREVLREKGYKRSDSAIRTMLRIMIKKEMVITDVEGKVTQYKAAVKRKDVESKIIRHVITTLFDENQEKFIERAIEESKLDKKRISQTRTDKHGI